LVNDARGIEKMVAANPTVLVQGPWNAGIRKGVSQSVKKGGREEGIGDANVISRPFRGSNYSHRFAEIFSGTGR